MVNPILARLNSGVTPVQETPPPTTTQEPTGNPILDRAPSPSPSPTPAPAPAPTGNPILDNIQPPSPSPAPTPVLQEIAESEGDLPEVKVEQADDLFGSMVRLREYLKINDPDSLEEADQWLGGVLKSYEHLLPEDGMPSGLEELEDKIPGDPGLFQQSVGWALGNIPLAHPALKGLEVLDKPAQGIQTALALALYDDEDRSAEMLAALGRGFTFRDQAEDRYGTDIDQNDDGMINAMEIVGLPPEWGKDNLDFGDWFGSGVAETVTGYTVGALDTVALALTDPTIWVGIGAVGKTKAGLEAVARTFGGRMGDDIARLVARRGMRALPPEMQTRIYRTMLNTFEETATSGGVLPRASRFGPRMGPEEAAMDAALQISRPTGRLSVAGVNYRTPLDTILDANPLRRSVRGAAVTRGVDLNIDRVDDLGDELSGRHEILRAAEPLETVTSPSGRNIDLVRVGDDEMALVLKDGDDALGHLVYNRADNTIDGIYVDPAARGARASDELYDSLGDLLDPDNPVDAIININRTGAAGATEAGEEALRSYLKRKGVQLDDTIDVDVARTGAGTRFLDSKVGQSVVQKAAAFKPRLVLRTTLGLNVEKLADHLRVIGDGRAAAMFDAMGHRLTGAQDRAVRQLQGFRGNVPGLRRIGGENALDTANRWVREALEGGSLERSLQGPVMDQGTNAVRVVDSLRAQGLDDVADFVVTAYDIRREIDDAAVRGGLDPDRLRQNYMPRVLTKEGMEEVLRNPELAAELRYSRDRMAAASEMRYQQPRQFRPDLTIDQANDELRRLTGVAGDVKIFEDDVLTAFATRGRSAYSAASQVDALDRMTRELIDDAPMAVWDDGGDATRRAIEDGYVPLQTPNGNIYMPPEIADEFAQFRDWITADKNLESLREFMNNWTKTWGAWATAPLIDGIGFHSRNAQGNLMLNALRGVINPKHYIRAMGLQRDVGNVIARMQDTGEALDVAMQSVIKSDADRRLIRTLMDNDIIDSGFFKDFSIDPDASRIWRLLGDNKLITSGRDIGNAVENNARIAHFVAKLDAPGGSVESAARSVREALFDYGDLTSVERSLRSVSRFYTFMRKNLGAQMWGLAHYPGRVAQIQQTTGQSGLGTVLGVQQPEYSVESGSTLINVLGSDSSVSGIDSPFLAALDVVSPIYEALQLAPVVGEAIPGEGDRERLVRSLYNLVSGGPVALTEFFFEQLQQKDTFLGIDLDDQGSESVWNDFVDAIIGPAWSQLDTFLARLGQAPITEGTFLEGGVGPLGNNPSNREVAIGDELIVLSNLLGLNVAEYGDRAEVNGLFALNEELAQRLENLDAPTLSQLEDAGIYTPPPAPPGRLRSEVTAEKIAELSAQGLPTDELELEYQERLATEAENRSRVDPETGEVSTATSRLRDFSASRGLLTDGGTGSTSTLAKILWNQENPGDPFLGEDGTPLDEYDVPKTNQSMQWYTASEDEVLEWALRTGAPLTEAGNVNEATQEAWNAANPTNVYYGEWSMQERAENGIRPKYGVFTYTDDDGNVVEVRGQDALGGESSLSETLFGRSG